ncbi:MAG: hypothetical protein ACE5JL_01720 [Dehalococcoidia bacterium]
MRGRGSHVGTDSNLCVGSDCYIHPPDHRSSNAYSRTTWFSNACTTYANARITDTYPYPYPYSHSYIYSRTCTNTDSYFFGACRYLYWGGHCEHRLVYSYFLTLDFGLGSLYRRFCRNEDRPEGPGDRQPGDKGSRSPAYQWGNRGFDANL